MFLQARSKLLPKKIGGEKELYPRCWLKDRRWERDLPKMLIVVDWTSQSYRMRYWGTEVEGVLCLHSTNCSVAYSCVKEESNCPHPALQTTYIYINFLFSPFGFLLSSSPLILVLPLQKFWNKKYLSVQIQNSKIKFRERKNKAKKETQESFNKSLFLLLQWFSKWILHHYQ